MSYQYTEQGIREGDTVKSDVTDLGKLPESFSKLCEGRDLFYFGIGLRITKDGIGVDRELKRFFKHLGGELWDPSKLLTDKDRALKDFINQVVIDYRTNGFQGRYPNVPHQVYGEIKRYELGDPKEPYSEYDDRLPHLDFVPPEDPVFAYFAADKFPTRWWTDDYEYRGNLHKNYRDFDMRAGISLPTPKLSSTEDFPAGHLLRSKDARTVLHAAPTDYKKGDFRTFGRLFVGPIPGTLSTKQ